MAKIFKAGEELRGDDGELLLTFSRDYMASPDQMVPRAADVLLPNGEHPVKGEIVDSRIFRLLEIAALGDS